MIFVGITTVVVVLAIEVVILVKKVPMMVVMR